jgi:ABC-type phosphate/phosphonate transport system substrate-binding protein
MFIKLIKYIGCIGYIWLAVFPLSSCQKRGPDNKFKVDFSRREEIPYLAPDPQRPLTAAVSAMISPQENFFFYNRIFEYISKKIGRKIIYKQRKTYREVNDQLSRQELDFAFIGASAYVEAKNDDITVSARVEYLYETLALNPVEMRVVMAEASRKISK